MASQPVSALPTSYYPRRGTAVDRRVGADLDVLELVLGLERLSEALVRDGLARFGADHGEVGRPPLDLPVHFTEIRKRVGWRPERPRRQPTDPTLRRLHDHERFHVKLIASRIAEIGADPIAPARYTFGFATFAEFLDAAVRVKDGLVRAYSLALGSVGNPALRSLLADLLVIEAHHAAHLHLRTGDGPFSFAAEAPRTRAEIAAIVGAFVVAA